MSQSNRRWLTPEQAAEYLGVTVRSIRNYIAKGALPAYRVRAGKGKSGKVTARLLRIDQNDLDSMLSPVPTTGDER